MHCITGISQRSLSMTETMRTWVEIAFNICYLVAIWGIVIAMFRHQAVIASQDTAVAGCVRWAFALLALGDTGHVGFRVIAYALGSLEAKPLVMGIPVSLVGI